MSNNGYKIIDLEIKCIIGKLPNERVEEQSLLLDINLDVNVGDSDFEDKIDETIDYTIISDMATKLAITKKYNLIESFCRDLNNLFLETFQVIQKTKISVKKPNAISVAKYATFTMEKTRR